MSKTHNFSPEEVKDLVENAFLRDQTAFNNYFVQKIFDLKKLKVDELKIILKIIRKYKPSTSLTGNKPQLLISLEQAAFPTEAIKNARSNGVPAKATPPKYNKHPASIGSSSSTHYHTPHYHHTTPNPANVALLAAQQAAVQQAKMLAQAAQNLQNQIKLLNASVNNNNESFLEPPAKQNDTLANIGKYLYNIQHKAPNTTSASIQYSPYGQQVSTVISKAVMSDPQFDEKQSPFFQEVEKLIVQQYRDSIGLTILNLDDFTWKMIEEVQKRKLAGQPPILDEHSIQVRLFNKQTNNDVIYQSNLRLTVNEKLASSDFKKIRTKVFSSPCVIEKPIDITHFLKKSGNRIQLQFHGTYGAMVVQLVKNKTLAQVVDSIKLRSELEESQTVDKKQKKNEDDIEELTYDLTVRCPLSFKIIEIPAKSKKCTHNQCFDLYSYTEYSNQQQLWNCPICHMAASPSQLYVDSFFQKLLSQAPPSCENITIFPDGHWEYKTDNYNDQDSDDEKHVGSIDLNGNVTGGTNNSLVVVVDLLSDDEDDAPTITSNNNNNNNNNSNSLSNSSSTTTTSTSTTSTLTTSTLNSNSNTPSINNNNPSDDTLAPTNDNALAIVSTIDDDDDNEDEVDEDDNEDDEDDEDEIYARRIQEQEEEEEEEEEEEVCRCGKVHRSIERTHFDRVYHQQNSLKMAALMRNNSASDPIVID